MGSIILVTGVAGVGKTSLSSALARRLEARFIDLPEYVRKNKLYSSYDEEEQAYLIDLRRVSARIGAEAARAREELVIASVYVFKPRKATIRYVIVLRLRPDRLIQVLLDRGYPPRKVAENVSAELVDQPLHEALRFGHEKVIQIDVTGRDLEMLAEKIAEGIMGREAEKLSVEVNWISELEKIGRLDYVLNFLSKHG